MPNPAVFSQVVNTLLTNTFVCSVTYYDEYQYLKNRNNFELVERYLSQIQLRISSTEDQDVFFLAYEDIHPNAKKAAKDVFSDIKQNLRPCIEFIELIMRMQQCDHLITGSVIEAHKLMSQIDTNPSFREQLQTLGRELKFSSDGTDRTRLDKLLKFMKDRGYIVLSNAEREIYKVTGKIEYLHDVIQFLTEHENIKEDNEEEQENNQQVGLPL